MILGLRPVAKTLMMINQHWFRQWFGAVRQQATIWVNVEWDLCPHMASLGQYELTPKRRETHGCVVSTVATDALVLKHQAISIHNADQTFIVLDQFHII